MHKRSAGEVGQGSVPCLPYDRPGFLSPVGLGAGWTPEHIVEPAAQRRREATQTALQKLLPSLCYLGFHFGSWPSESEGSAAPPHLFVVILWGYPKATPRSLRVEPGPVPCETNASQLSCSSLPTPFHLGLRLSGASRPRECQTQDRLWWATGSEAPGGGFEGRDFGGSERLAGLGDLVSSTRGPGMEKGTGRMGMSLGAWPEELGRG